MPPQKTLISFCRGLAARLGIKLDKNEQKIHVSAVVLFDTTYASNNENKKSEVHFYLFLCVTRGITSQRGAKYVTHREKIFQ